MKKQAHCLSPEQFSMLREIVQAKIFEDVPSYTSDGCIGYDLRCLIRQGMVRVDEWHEPMLFDATEKGMRAVAC